MPIRRHHRFFYPIDWVQLSNMIRFRRAKGRCEACGRPHGETVAHLGDGRWWDAEVGLWRSGKGRVVRNLPPLALDTAVKRTKVVLACAHLDHDPGNNEMSNLKALCQRCHMLHDKLEHLRQRRITYSKRKALGDLFLGRYE
ncbi:MAG: hypothetical protein EOP69_01565 [Spirochaetia bacterium]|nr:MAG: hypothetical protein EOP69_01565 [Spirochaetia bacterium]